MLRAYVAKIRAAQKRRTCHYCKKRGGLDAFVMVMVPVHTKCHDGRKAALKFWAMQYECTPKEKR